MTETIGKAASAAREGTSAVADNPLADLAHSEAADRLKAEVQDYLGAQATRLLGGLGQKLGETTNKLNDVAEGKSSGLGKLVAEGGKKLAEGKGPLRSAVELGGSQAKDKVKGALKGMGGGKGKRTPGNKPTVILESVDIGVPVRTAYDQWTQFEEFSTFAKGVKQVSKDEDDVTSDWQLNILWSSRSWKAQTSEQVPDERIAWSSEGSKATTKGVVSFHRLGDNLTRILLVMEYYPAGFFEKTGNIWRAQGRRARLDLKNFARFITLKGEAEAEESWRGEIRDGEVVRSHEDALAEEEEAESGEPRDDGAEGEPQEDEPPAGEAGGSGENGEPEAEDAYGEDEEPADTYDEEDEYEDEYPEEADDEAYEDDEPRAEDDESGAEYERDESLSRS